MVAQLVYRLDSCGSIPVRGRDVMFPLCYCILTSPGAHSASYPMGTWGCYPSGTAARA